MISSDRHNQSSSVCVSFITQIVLQLSSDTQYIRYKLAVLAPFQIWCENDTKMIKLC